VQLVERLKKRNFNIQAEVSYINYKVYGGNQYIKANGDDGSLIQLIVPADIGKSLQLKHYYEFNGAFEVSSSPDYGFFQFRVASAQVLGKDMKMEAKKQAAHEIIEKGYLDKYKNDFSGFRSKSQCTVALVTSQQSQVIGDVMEVFKSHKGIKHEVIPVKLNDANLIAEGIIFASGGEYDVILVIRGGGNDSDFAVFNDPYIAKAIHDSKIPVIVGIGHTDNNTFADKAADRSETTPSKAARFLVDALGQPVQNTYQAPQYKQPYRKSNYKANRSAKNFGKSEAGTFVFKFGLAAILVIIAGILFFTLIPKVFENIIKTL
jgi:exodeoxyribonuclease VII large subunit